MKRKIEFCVIIVLVLLLPGAAYPQQESLADAARRMRAEKLSGTQPPQLLRTTVPFYPPEAREGHRSGTVVMAVLLGKEGNVMKATVVSGDPIFHAARPWQQSKNGHTDRLLWKVSQWIR